MRSGPLTSMVGSYSSTKWFWMSWMVRALFPTPPAPTTTSLYSVIAPGAAAPDAAVASCPTCQGGLSATPRPHPADLLSSGPQHPGNRVAARVTAHGPPVAPAAALSNCVRGSKLPAPPKAGLTAESISPPCTQIRSCWVGRKPEREVPRAEVTVPPPYENRSCHGAAHSDVPRQASANPRAPRPHQACGCTQQVLPSASDMPGAVPGTGRTPPRPGGL